MEKEGGEDGEKGGMIWRREIKRGMFSQRRRMKGGSSSWEVSEDKSWSMMEKMIRPSLRRSERSYCV